MEQEKKLAELICKIIEEKNWGLYFLNEPMQSLPVQEHGTTLYRVNSVKLEQLSDAILEKIENGAFKWEKPSQTEQQSSNGIEKMSKATEE